MLRYFAILILIILTPIPLFSQVKIQGWVFDKSSGDPIPYVNIGILNKNAGTLTDLDGSFVLNVPESLENDTITIAALGYETEWFSVPDLMYWKGPVRLKQSPITLSGIEVMADKDLKKIRLGWMRGKDGTLPVSASEGGACSALLLEAPSAPFLIDKVYLRILYNTKDSIKFRLRIFDVDNLTGGPGRDLIQKDIVITAQKRAGWIKMDLAPMLIEIPEKRFFAGFEWLDDRETRNALVTSLKEWSSWKEKQYQLGDKRSHPDTVYRNGQMQIAYSYSGNMMNWPGFKEMPPWTGLVVDDKKRSGNKKFITYERKMSFGKWEKIESVLNAVLVISY